MNLRYRRIFSLRGTLVTRKEESTVFREGMKKVKYGSNESPQLA